MLREQKLQQFANSIEYLLHSFERNYTTILIALLMIRHPSLHDQFSEVVSNDCFYESIPK